MRVFFIPPGAVTIYAADASSEFTPASVSGLALWLDAALGVYQDAAMTTPATTDGQSVQAWADQSGNDHHFTQDTAGKIPLLKLTTNGINNLPVVSFDGGDMLVNSTAFLTGTSGAVFAVMRPGNIGNEQHLMASADQASTTRWMRLYANVGGNIGLYQRNNDTSDGLRVHTDTILAWPYVVAWFSDGSTSGVATDGWTEALGVFSGANNGDWFGDVAARDNVTIGGLRTTSDANYYIGTVAEILAYEPYPSAADMANIAAYLCAKYGIAQYAACDLSDMEAIGAFDSPDPAIPEGAVGASDDAIREPGNVLYEPTDTGAEYKTWYTGRLGEVRTIHYAYSTDGKTWTKHATQPIIGARQGEDPYVVSVGGTYHLYCEDVGLGAPWNVRRWSSTDLTTWTDEGLLTGIADQQPASPTVWIEGATWYMLYESLLNGVNTTRLATSSDGLEWTDNATNPVFTIADMVWDSYTDAVPDDILKLGVTYYMIYHSHDVYNNARSGLATSTNLTSWTDMATSPMSFIRGSAAVGSFQYCYDGTTLALLGIQGSEGAIRRGYPVKRSN